VPAFVVVEQTIHNAEAMSRYRQGGPATLDKYGGTVLIAGTFVESLEVIADQPWEGQRFLVVQFEDIAAARRWYQSPEYSEPMQYRETAATTRIFIAESAG
jgi:uncharacterized protein (DUF1330 family)